MPTPSPVLIDGETLMMSELVKIARHNAPVALANGVAEKVAESRRIVERIVDEDTTVYSINTGFGALSDIKISPADIDTLQLNFVRSHAAGTDKILPAEVVRAMMALRANTLAKGYSGVRLEVITLLVEMLNKGVVPIVPSQGSLGASGDLAPLAHLALVLIGEGRAKVDGESMPGDKALAKVGLKPITLRSKEGLALVNGTQMMTALGVLNYVDADVLCKVADITASMSVDGFMGSHKPFADMVQEVRPHPGQAVSASNCRRMLQNSQIAHSHAHCKKVQDPYSFRCTPQVHGAIRDTLTFVRQVLERELNAATDNPLIFPETGEAVSQGNFHGEPLAFAMDFLGIAMAELGSISERRVDKLNDPHFSELPAFLTRGQTGLNSGTMIVHYTAASLVSENKILAHPASTDSIPTSNNKEDHVSM
ncbi:MAG: histidine ammonia-lyase, partial [Cyanobacteria bacterium HKST-UBA05]|nr:histidine ammonia-lyase [Cyanobacteria bacterium HKST-UBA05]